VSLGCAEILIRSGDVTYVAPALVADYAAAHSYRPPAVVLKALARAGPGSRPVRRGGHVRRR
jgi:hypothetical protein